MSAFELLQIWRPKVHRTKLAILDTCGGWSMSDLGNRAGRFRWVLAAAFLIPYHGLAWAASLTSSASASWDNFGLSMQVLGSGSFGFFEFPNTAIDASSESDAQSVSQDSFASLFMPINVTADSLAGSGTASASFVLSASTTLGVDANNSTAVRASALSERSGRLTFTGSGVFVATAPYSLSASLSPGNPESTAFAEVFMSATLLDPLTQTFGSFDTSSRATLNFSVLPSGSNAPGSDTKSGTLALAIAFEDGDVINFYARAAASSSFGATAPVPLPGALPAFAVALCSIFVSRRRRAG